MELDLITDLQIESLGGLPSLGLVGPLHPLLGSEINHVLHRDLTHPVMVPSDARHTVAGVIQLQLGERLEVRHDGRHTSI